MATEEEMRIFEAGCKRLLRRLHSIPRRDIMAYPNRDDNKQVHEIGRRWIEDEQQGFKSECTCGRKFEASTRTMRQALEVHHLQNHPDVARGI
jgi:hypothetical protein